MYSHLSPAPYKLYYDGELQVLNALASVSVCRQMRLQTFLVPLSLEIVNIR